MCILLCIWKSLAGWTFAFKDYYDLNITQDVDLPNMLKLGQIDDPYSKIQLSWNFKCWFIYIGYFDRYNIVKLLQIQSSGDEFFLPDNEVKSLVHQFYDLLRLILRMHSGKIYKLLVVVHI